MSKVLKSGKDPITEELLNSFIGKLISVPTNEHVATQELTGKQQTVNVWFAGTVAGFEKATIGYDFANEQYLEEPIVTYNLILTDGMGYILSPKNCVVEEVTEEEFVDMVQEYERKQAVKNSIILPDGKTV